MIKLLLPLLSLTLTLMLCGAPARAQGLTPRPGMGRTPTKTETPSGPAEAAEEEKEDQPDLPPLPPWPGQETKRLQLFELAGYFRFRTDMFHNLNLGMFDGGGYRAPFYTPVSEARNLVSGDSISSLSCKARKSKAVPGGDLGDRELEEDDCPANTLGGANMRLRLQPTVNVGEQVRVHAMIDVFDNLALGSTPAPEAAGRELALFQDSQDPSTGSILVKRAWAEVVTPLGPIQFGRMPVHWGMGILANDGNCWDCNFGDNADRVMFKADVAGYTLGMGYDFNSSGPTSFGVQGLTTYGGQAVDLEQLDDVDQWFWVAGRIDPEDVIRDRVDRGQLVFNYGVYLVWRKQDFDYASTQTGSSKDDYAKAFVERHGWTLMPDLWFKLLWKKLSIEFEGLFIGGRIGNVSDEVKTDDYSIVQFGWALRSSYKLLDDALSFGLEVGMASGDQAEPSNADLNRRRWSPLGVNADGSRIDGLDNQLREFRFNFDYHVDLILFRELLGTVANAVYFKPWAQYLIVDSFGARLDLIYSMAHEPVGFPGNSRNLGVELNLDIFYRNVEEKFFAGLQYGVLFPLGALDRPRDIFGETWEADAEVAHTLQARMIVKF
jgi:uncharacterized protein (TIGR04551 family)